MRSACPALLALLLAACGGEFAAEVSDEASEETDAAQASPGDAGATGPGGDASTADGGRVDGGVNRPPTVTLPVTYQVDEGQTLTLLATGSDPDGEALSYSWAQRSGAATATLGGSSGAQELLTAPGVASDSVITIEVTACDPLQQCARATTAVTIKDSANDPPVITSVTANPSPVDEAVRVTLAVAATDPNKETLTTAWTQSAGPAVTLSSTSLPSVGFLAPAVSADTTLTFSAKVCDPRGACASKSVSVLVKNVDLPPVFPAQGNVTVRSGDPVQLDASGASDPEGEALTFSWAQTMGSPTVILGTAKTNTATFTAPVASSDFTLSFTVTICDTLKQCTTGVVQVKVLGVGTYVSAGGDDASGLGTQAKPWRTIAAGIRTAVALGALSVSVDRGDYPENVQMKNGVDVVCGFDRTAGWTRPSSGAVSRVLCSASPGVNFGPGVTARLDRCKVAYGGGSTSTALAMIQVREAATLVDVDVDATDSTGASVNTYGVLMLAVTGSAVVPSTTITNGKVVGGNGSTGSFAVYAGAGTRLTVSGATLTGGAAGNLGANAFGVNLQGVSGSASSAVTLTSAVISGGDADPAGGFSAGVFTSPAGPGTVTVSGCTISGGTGFTRRGVRLDSLTSASITSSTISGGSNSAPGSEGSGIFVFGKASASPFLIDSNVSISGGSSPAGNASGINFRPGSGGTVSRNALIRGSTGAGKVLAGVLIDGAGPSIDANPSISGGPAGASGQGFGILIKGGATASITGNGIRGGDGALNLAGVEVEGGTPTISGNTIVGGNPGAGSYASGVYVKGTSANPTLSANPSIRGGSGAAAGLFGIGIESGTATIDSNTLIVGSAGTGPGVGITTASAASPSIKNNTAIKGGDGAATDLVGIDVEAGTPVIDSNILVLGGPATSSALGVYLKGGAAVVKQNTLVRGADGAGGSAGTAYGLLAGAGGTLSDNSFEGGTASGAVVGVQLDGASGLVILHNTIAGGVGGSEAWGLRDGAFLSSTAGFSTALEVNNNFISAIPRGKTSTNTFGATGGMFLRGTTGKIWNNRVVGGTGVASWGLQVRDATASVFSNYFSGEGGGATLGAVGMNLGNGGTAGGKYDDNILDSGRTATLRYAVTEEAGFLPVEFKNNDFFPESSSSAALYHQPLADAKNAVQINAIRAGYSGNMVADPQFQNPAGRDYHLKSTTPLKGMGLGTSAGAPPMDMDDDPRPASAADIGPDEIP